MKTGDVVVFQLEYLNGHLFGKELFIWFTLRVYRESLCLCFFQISVLRVSCEILINISVPVLLCSCRLGFLSYFVTDFVVQN